MNKSPAISAICTPAKLDAGTTTPSLRRHTADTDITQFIHRNLSNAVLDCSRKFHNIKNSYIPLRKVNDRICQEFGLSIIENLEEKGKHYAEWSAEKKGQSSKLLKFRAQGQERFTRSKTLGADYNLETLRDCVGKAKQPRRKKKIRLEKNTRINLFMDIQA